MKRSEFKDKMLEVKNLSANIRYTCQALNSVFGGYSNEKTSVVRLYSSIINGHDGLCYGMFGECYIEANKDARRLSIEMFEYIVLDEKLYKQL